MLVKAIDINKNQTFIEIDPDLLKLPIITLYQQNLSFDFSFDLFDSKFDLFDSKVAKTIWKKVTLSDNTFYYEQQIN